MLKPSALLSVSLAICFIGSSTPSFAQSPYYAPQEQAYPNQPYQGQPSSYQQNSNPDAAEDAPTGDPSTDPQARVGRISLIEGTVSFHTADESDWSYATLNYPVTGGSSFWTEPNARAEIQVGASALRLDNATEVDVNELDDHMTDLTLQQGTISLHVGDLNDGVAYQVDTPDEKIVIDQAGTYRISAGSEQTASRVAVLRGRAEISDSATSVTIEAGETATIPPGNLASISVEETHPTSFDNWSLSRDNFEQPRRVAQYVSPQMTGYEDLGSYGSWHTVADYGPVWTPANVDENWEPYRFGRWVWVSPWGWTWVDEQPWGFAPFHYGRWAYIDHSWCWAPGRIAEHPVYAPALVAFIGGNNWHLSVGFGGGEPVGWFPLGPGEAYHPGYRVSPRYVQNLNITNVTNVTRINNFGGPNNSFYANRRFATVVPRDALTSSRPIGGEVMHVSPQLLSRAPVRATSSVVSIEQRGSTPIGRPHNDENAMTRAPTPPVKPLISENRPEVSNHEGAPRPLAHTAQPARAPEPISPRAEGAPSPLPRETAPVNPTRVQNPGGSEHAPGPPIRRPDTTVPANENSEDRQAVPRPLETRQPAAAEERPPEASSRPEPSEPYQLHLPTAEEQRQMREREENQPVPERSPSVPVTHSEVPPPEHEASPERPQIENRPNEVKQQETQQYHQPRTSEEAPQQHATPESRPVEPRPQQPQQVREIAVQRPTQTAPLTPSHQGWTRSPTEPAPQQHPPAEKAEPQHQDSGGPSPNPTNR